MGVIFKIFIDIYVRKVTEMPHEVIRLSEIGVIMLSELPHFQIISHFSHNYPK